MFVIPLFTNLPQIRRDCFTSILSKLADIIQQIQTRPLTEYEKNEMKNAILDRIGCGLGAQRLALGQEISSYVQQNPCEGSSMLIYRQLLPEHSEKPWIHETKIRDLANRIHVGCKSSLDEYSSRQRTAHVLLALKNGEQFESHSKNSRWSETRPTWAEICEKFRTNVGSLFPLSQIEQIITKVDNLDQIKDICELTKLLSPE